MKILAQGHMELARKPKTFKCLECGCVFEADNTEYKYDGSQYNQDYYVCACPCCGRKAYSE